MSELLRLISLQDDATRKVLLGCGLLGLSAGLVGAFAVLRRRALVGDAIAHASLPGVCLAYFVVGQKSFAAFLAGALVFGLLSVGCIVFIRAYTRVKEDAAIGIVLASFFGLGIVLSRIIQKSPSGSAAGIDGFLYGKAATMVWSDVRTLAIVAAVAVAAIALLQRPFRALAFDRGFTASIGWNVVVIDLALMTLLSICTVAGLPAVGVVLMAAMLIIPAVAARFWTDRLSTMLVLAGAFGFVSALVGGALSAQLPSPAGSSSHGWPAGPLITLTAAACFAVSLLFAPKRGVLARAWSLYTLRRRTGVQHLLRELWESAEASTNPDAAPPPPVQGRRFRNSDIVAAHRRGLVVTKPDGMALTPAGDVEAVRVVRAHRLWELFLITDAGIATDHVDRAADQIEHHLPPELLAELERQLAAEGRLPAVITAPLPPSPHPLAHTRRGA